ncbi:MAG: hypothetical protein KAH38_01335 [Candidatus Hydrogenedentes bacterium]|nr:hypothetical protein [Candidatus Hydrogenedentota bacterium]
MKIFNKHLVPAVMLVCCLSTLSYGEDSVATWHVKPIAQLEGLDVPECMLPDVSGNRIYVSNIECAPKEYWEDDGKGYISVFDKEGTLVEKRWLDSRPGAVINSPKGMAILNGFLYFTDNARLMRTPLDNPKALETVELPDTGRLNDAASDGKEVFVSDLAAGKIFAVKPDKTFRMIPAPESVNGVTVHEGVLYAVSWDLGEVYELDITGRKAPKPFGLKGTFKNLDAVFVLDDGAFIVSDFPGGRVAIIEADRKTVHTLVKLESPADIGVDLKNNRLYVPQLMVDKAVVYKFWKE